MRCSLHRFHPVAAACVLLLALASAHDNDDEPPTAQPQTLTAAHALQNVTGAEGGGDSLEAFLVARQLLLDGDVIAMARNAQHWLQSAPYLQASALPMRVYECVRDCSLLRCMKLYVLQRLEDNSREPGANVSGDLRQAFMQQLFGGDNDQQMDSLIKAEYAALSDSQLNVRLRKNFERFFAHRELKLAHLLPGMLVKIVPSKSGKLQFSLKKNKGKKLRAQGRAATKSDEVDETLNGGSPHDLSMMMSGMSGTMKKPGGSGGGGGGLPQKVKNKKANSYKQTILQMAVPVMVLPAILMGSFLPFVLPVLKMATIMTLLLNNGAFLAALIYAARTHANGQEEQHISYGPPGFH